MDGSIEPAAPPRKWKFVVLHHSATESGSVEAIDAVHRRRRDQFGNHWPGIGYHFVIGNGQGMPDGQIAPTFRWQDQLDGAHARSRRHNLEGIGVCLVGDFEQTAPTPRQISALGELLEQLVLRYDVEPRRVVRHLDVAATRCPGRLFPFEEVRSALEERLAVTVA